MKSSVNSFGRLSNSAQSFYSSSRRAGSLFQPSYRATFASDSTIDMQSSSADTVLEKKEVQEHEFKAETRKLLDIVAHSIYKDKDVFLRELLSNCSDALEKQRFAEVSGTSEATGEPLEVFINTNLDKKTLTIEDTGIGMTREDLVENLGTIARSGTKSFIEEFGGEEEEDDANITTTDSLIGQFGVGFYSAFMVGNTLEVLSKTDKCDTAHLWVSDGTGSFEVSEVEAPSMTRGTKITIHLRSEALNFAKSNEITKTIQKYSHFISHPIHLNGQVQNSLHAIWARDKREVTEDEYTKFWEYLTNQKVPYKYRLHYSSDVPLAIKSLIYIPNNHMEKFGLGVENLELSLYSRKVLIKKNCTELVPQWMRFVKGVVDCEDIPLALSRENYQDSALMARLKQVITKRIIKLLHDEARKDPEKYLHWYKEFGNFLKEGLAMDSDHQDNIFPLIRFESNFNDELITVDDYVKKMKKGQDKIYFVFAPDKQSALSSPYMEAFKDNDVPILFTYQHVDEMIFRQVGSYKKYNFVNVETSFEEISRDLNLDKDDKGKNVESLIPEEDIMPLKEWIKNELQPFVSQITISKRLKDSPAIIVSEISSGLRQVMQMVEKSDMADDLLKQQTLEINPNHELIVSLNEVRKSDPKLGSLVAQQILDNALLLAGINRNPQVLVNRVNRLMTTALKGGQAAHTVFVPKKPKRKTKKDSKEE